MALGLLHRVGQGPEMRYRLVGVGLGNFVDVDGARQAPLFE